VSSAQRGRKVRVKATIDQSNAPAEWKSNARTKGQGGGEVGVIFGMRRVVPDGGIEKGAPEITIGYAVLVGDSKVRLIQLTRDGEHRLARRELADANIGGGRGKRALEVKVEGGSVSVSVDGKRVSLPLKASPAELDGFVGFVFDGVGYASLAQPAITVGGN